MPSRAGKDAYKAAGALVFETPLFCARASACYLGFLHSRRSRSFESPGGPESPLQARKSVTGRDRDTRRLAHVGGTCRDESGHYRGTRGTSSNLVRAREGHSTTHESPIQRHESTSHTSFGLPLRHFNLHLQQLRFAFTPPQAQIACLGTRGSAFPSASAGGLSTAHDVRGRCSQGRTPALEGAHSRPLRSAPK